MRVKLERFAGRELGRLERLAAPLGREPFVGDEFREFVELSGGDDAAERD